MSTSTSEALQGSASSKAYGSDQIQVILVETLCTCYCYRSCSKFSVIISEIDYLKKGASCCWKWFLYYQLVEIIVFVGAFNLSH
jgi:hypothetical protein